MRKLLLLTVLAALAAPAPAVAARFAVGVQKGVSAKRLAERIEARTGSPVSTIGPFALAVKSETPPDVGGVSGVAWVERLGLTRRLTFTPNDPLADRQWYLDRIKAFQAWPQPPVLADVRVAVIDSGVDAEHPELAGRILAARSFVGGSARKDTNGHGTFVAGQIAAELNNGQGIAGIGFPVHLLVAKVVRPDETISPEAEARAIRWSINRGAQVVNLSFGGVRDPFNRDRDTYSPLEAAAVEYAVGKGALVVAAVGNADKAPEEPWLYASYPAALPHVLGVSAIRRDGSVPSFSNRDQIYNDLAAPGEEIFSTLPRALTTGTRVICTLPGYSDCGPLEFRRGEGTSFAAPQVAAAAALVFGEYPLMQADQVATVLTRAAVDANPSRGCKRCSSGRDALTGWGVLDVTAALQSIGSSAPDPDQFEANDEAGLRAATLAVGSERRIRATIDYWDDEVDVYRVFVRRGQLLRATMRGPRGADTNLFLWKPGTRRVEGLSVDPRRLAARSQSPGSIERIRFRARKSGWYYLEVKIATPGAGSYSLKLRRLNRRAGLRVRAAPH